MPAKGRLIEKSADEKGGQTGNYEKLFVRAGLGQNKKGTMILERRRSE